MSSPALCGRQRELELAVAGLTGVPRGLGCSYAIVGEPGIGKTRLLTELAERSLALGMRTCWGRAWETGGAPALWPWRQLLESLQVSATEGPLKLVWSQSSGFEFSASDPRQARFELFDAVVRALREQAQTQPLLCALDDLHAADIASVELADFAITALKSSAVAWLVTYRDAEAERLPVRDPLARLSRRCTVLQLPRLSRADTSALVKGLLPGSAEELAEQLFVATSGNPLFLCETARALANRRTTDLSAEQLPVGQGVTLVVRERVAALSSEARALVDVAAALGRDVPIDLLAAAVGQTAASTRVLAAEVLAVGLWSESAPDRYQFGHALVRDALYREIEPARRHVLQTKVVAALDALVTAGRTDLAFARALHALECARLGASPGDAEQISAWVLAAAEHARAQRGYEEVATLLDRALRELSVSEHARVELLLALGAAQGDLGNVAALHRTFDEAISLARRTQAPTQLARAVLGRAQVYVLGDVRTELIALIDEGLARLPANETALKARLQARKAAAMTPAAAPAEPLHLAREALASVAHSSDDRLVLDVTTAAGSAFGDFAPAAERVEVNTAMVRAARRLADRAAELRGLSRLVTDHLEAGDVVRADAVLLERDALATSLGHARFRWQTPLFAAMRAMIEGQFDVCARCVQEARRLIVAVDDENAWRVLVVHEAWALLLQDRVDALRALEPELLRRTAVMPAYADLLRTLTLARGGHFATAREHLERITNQLHFVRATHMLAAAGETAVLCGDVALARHCYALLQPHADANATVGLFGFWCGPPIRGTLGMLASAIGRPEDETVAHFEAALERTGAMGASAHEVWVRLWFGQHLEEPAAAQKQLNACAALATKLGMHGVAARAGGVRVEPARPAPAAVPAPEFTLQPFESGWKLVRGSSTLVLKDHRGVGMLARLLERPGEEVHALALVSSDAELEAADVGDAGEMLDEQARREYRRRIQQLSERIEDSEERGDAREAEMARTELEALSRELSRAVGLGGRARRVGSAAERARVTAQRRIREAIRRIGELDAEIGALLDRTIRTGTFCAYEPNRKARP